MRIILLLFLFLPLELFAQSKNDSDISMTDSLLMEINRNTSDTQFYLNHIDRYKIYPTENVYVMLKLDTRTGQIDLIQWALDENKEFSVKLNSKELNNGLDFNGLFELYPTKNMYQFILLNKLYGTTWHVQWGTKESERWIRRLF